MIKPEIEAEILRLHHAEHWPVGTIARELRCHHSTVRRVLAQAGVPAAVQLTRSSIADPYLAFIVQTLTQYPTLRASRLHRMACERGYPGGADHFRAIVARYRPRPAAEAYLRLRSLPAEQMQIDWAHFGHLVIGRARRPLMAFVMVLSYSRHLFLRFYLNAAMGSFMRGHVDAFTYFSGVARTALYDNLKSAVLERVGDAIHFHPKLLELAAAYRFQPRPVAPYRGNQKGRVERSIKYIREAFFAARQYTSLEDLNAQALHWCLHEAAARPCPEDRTRSVRECFEEERSRLLPLPENPFPTEECVEVKVQKTPYARFDLNDYSLPHTHVRRTLSVLATLDTVRIVDGTQVIATHPRSFDQHAQVELPEHVDALRSYKRAARTHSGMDRLHHSAPSAQALFTRAAERGGHLGSITRGLLRLLDTHGAAALEAALAAALQEDAAHLSAVRHFIDQHQAHSGQPPPIAVTLPENARVRTLIVRTHDLKTYTALAQSNAPPSPTEESAVDEHPSQHPASDPSPCDP
jgi:transposase